jgi:hypothetical protein
MRRLILIQIPAIATNHPPLQQTITQQISFVFPMAVPTLYTNFVAGAKHYVSKFSLPDETFAENCRNALRTQKQKLRSMPVIWLKCMLLSSQQLRMLWNRASERIFYDLRLDSTLESLQLRLSFEFQKSCPPLTAAGHECLVFQVERLQMENRRNISSRAAVEDLLTQKLDLAKSERFVESDLTKPQSIRCIAR